MEKKIIDIIKKVKPNINLTKKKVDFIKKNLFDSFDIITIISEIEKEFDIKIDADEIKPKNFNSLKNIEKLIKKNIK
jgi:acyl carrier protein